MKNPAKHACDMFQGASLCYFVPMEPGLWTRFVSVSSLMQVRISVLQSRHMSEQACAQLQFFLDLKHIFCQNKQKDKIENTG